MSLPLRVRGDCSALVSWIQPWVEIEIESTSLLTTAKMDMAIVEVITTTVGFRNQLAGISIRVSNQS